MPDDLNDENRSLLAAEYVLGSLDADERTRAKVLLDVNPEFRAMVRIWERRLGELQLMVEPVEPDTKIWERIKGKLQEVVPLAPLTAPARSPAMAVETPTDQPDETVPEDVAEPAAADSESFHSPPLAVEPAASEPQAEAGLAPAVEPPRRTPSGEAGRLPGLDRIEPVVLDRPVPEPRPPLRGVSRESRAFRSEQKTARAPRIVAWRAFASVMTVVALCLAGLIAAWRFIPNQLPMQLRPASVLNSVVAPAQSPRKAVPGTQFEE